MSPDVFRKLAALGLDHDQMAGVLEIMDAAAKAAADADEARKAKGRERWHRWQDKRQSNVSQHEQTLANDSHASVTRVEDNLLTKKITGQEEKKERTASVTRVSDLDAFKAELAPSLDAERIEAIVKHRRAKRGQMTAHAARLFAKDAAACGLSLPDAVDTCISRNWITVKPEYFADKANRSSTGPPRQNGRRTVMDAYHDIAREQGWTNEPTDIPGNHDDAQRLPAERGGGHEGVVVDLRRRLDGSFGTGGL